MKDIFAIYEVGLIKYEIEEIIRALDLACHISLNFEHNTIRYNRTRLLCDRLKTLIAELENA